MEPAEKQYLEMLKAHKKHRRFWGLFAPDYVQTHGLCMFIAKNYPDTELQRFLNQRFYVTGRKSLAHPFGAANYKTRFKYKTQHLCPIRNAWIDEEIARFEKL